MSEALELLLDNLGWVLAGVIVLLALVLWLLIRLARTSRAPEEAPGVSRADGAGAEEAVDLTVPPPRPDLRRSFARARSALRRAFPGRAVTYQRPWVLVLGPPLAGKTTLLARSRLGTPFGQPRQPPADRHPGVNWWALEGGIALDVVGEDLLRLDGLSSDSEEWKTILRRLRRSRPRRPIDGVVLTLPASSLLDDRKPLAQCLAEASRRGSLLHRKLGQAQRALGVQLPVYLLISHCDLIPGFGELLLDGVSPADRGQMLGWSNPASPDAPYSAAWVDHAFERLGDELEGFQLHRLSSDGRPAPPPEVVTFPDRLAALREPLRIYASQLFSPDASGEPLIFRGVYFCGGGSGRPAPPEATTEPPSEVAFAADLLTRKVFAEAGLARPTGRAAARARLARAALAAVAVAALLWTAWGAWRGGATVRAAAAEVQPLLATLADGATPAPAAGAGSAGPGRALIAAASEVDTFALRSASLPGSWLSRLPGRFGATVEDGFRRLALEPSRAVLVQQTEALIASRPVPADAGRDPSTVYALEGYPEFQALDRLTRDLARLDRVIASYQRFTPGVSLPAAAALEEFNRLATATLDDRLRPRGHRPARYLGRRLAGVSVEPFDYGESRFNERLEAKVVAWAGRYFEAVFNDNPLSRDLDAVLAAWIDGGVSRRPRASEIEQYRELWSALERLKRHLELPELQWTAADTLSLGDGFDEILRRVHVSRFLGPEVSDRLKREALARFSRLREQLAIYSTTDTGALLAGEEQAWTLSPRLAAVLDGLGGLLGQPFMQRRCTPLAMDRSPAGRNLLWQAKPLEEALALWTAYSGWDGSSELPPPLRDTSPEAAADAIAANLACLIAEAQQFEYPPASDDVGVIEDSIALQVRNLEANEQTLSGLLEALDRLGLRAQQADLAQILRDQRVHVLGQLDTLLASLALYQPLDGGFAWWQGGPAPGLAAFGAATPDDLATYLETQRKVAARLGGEYARPLLAMFGSAGQLALLKPVPPASRWQRITADLDAYQGKQAGNPLARLEEFVTAIAGNEAPALFDLYSCFGGMPAAAAAGGDFFLARRQALRAALVQRCSQLADERGYALYVELASVFNRRLWGRFPFAAPSAAGTATPDDLRAFFGDDFERARLLIDNLPPVSEWFGDKKEAVQQFMRRMAEVRAFFAPFLAPEAKSPLPVYDLAVRFRIERTLEQGANQIISWLMSVGEPAAKGDPSLDGDKVLDLLTTGSVSAAPDPERPPAPDARWLYGRPVTLTFRWATGSPYAPYASADGAAAARASVDGRTLVYRYREPWSLLRLLVESRAPAAEFPDLSEPRPVTVKLSIDTVSEDRPEPRAVANLYLQITLLSPDENRELSLPEFPTTEAPLTGPVVPVPQRPVAKPESSTASESNSGGTEKPDEQSGTDPPG